MHAVDVALVDRGVAGNVLRLLLPLLLLPAEHLVEEAELGVYGGGEEGEEQDVEGVEETHCFVLFVNLYNWHGNVAYKTRWSEKQHRRENLDSSPNVVKLYKLKWYCWQHFNSLSLSECSNF